MLEFISAKCPNCGMALEIEKGRDFAYCTYCGTKIIINNTNEYIFHNVDEAEIKRAEVDREIRLRELELEAKKDKHRRVFIWLWAIACLIFAIPGIFGLIIENEGLTTMFYIDLAIFVEGAAYLLIQPNENKNKETLSKSNNSNSSRTISDEFQKLGDSVTDTFKQAFNNIFKK